MHHGDTRIPIRAWIDLALLALLWGGSFLAIRTALDEIGLSGFGSRDPETLSGGQKARVALMRMLLAEPEALLLDEPFSRLDAALRDHVRKLVFETARNRNLPVLLVTHDQSDADAAGGRIIQLGQD